MNTTTTTTTTNNNNNNSELIEIYPGTKLPSIRELVKAKQNQRTHSIRNKSLQRAEDLLMKWQPSINSHKEIVAAVEGDHPYQNLKDQNEIGNENANRSDSNIVIQQWYNENEEFFRQSEGHGINFAQQIEPENKTKNKKINREEIQENDNNSFVLTPVEPLTAVTPFGTVSSSRYNTDIRTRQTNNNEDHQNNLWESLSLPPRSYHGPRVQSIYNLYYEQPIPMNYIDTMCQSPCNISGERRYHWDQTFGDFESNDGHSHNIIPGCLSWMGCDK